MVYHVIGDEDTVLGYRFAGVGATVAEDEDAARAAFHDVLASGSCRILMLTRPVAAMLERELTEHRLTAQPPFVVEVGDIWNTPVPHKSLEQLIYEAVGIRIVREDDEGSAND